MYGLNRHVCDVLEEMRTCTKTLNFALLPSLIEETQTMVNRMEMALADMRDLKFLKEEIVKNKRQYEMLKKKVEKLEENLEELEEEEEDKDE